MRTAALLFCSNQVSVKNIKSRVCSVIKSLIKNVFPAKNLTFNKANLSVLEILLFAPSCLGAVCGTQGMITLFKDLLECNSLCFDWAAFLLLSPKSTYILKPSNKPGPSPGKSHDFHNPCSPDPPHITHQTAETEHDGGVEGQEGVGLGSVASAALVGAGLVGEPSSALVRGLWGTKRDWAGG